jgi:hypothetical protein
MRNVPTAIATLSGRFGAGAASPEGWCTPTRTPSGGRLLPAGFRARAGSDPDMPGVRALACPPGTLRRMVAAVADLAHRPRQARGFRPLTWPVRSGPRPSPASCRDFRRGTSR